MANPLPKKRGPHMAGCSLNKPPEWFKTNLVNGEPSGPERAEYCSCGGNPLQVEELARMRIPRSLWGCDLAGVTDAIKTRVTNFTQRLHRAKQEASGLYLYGEAGTGKSGAAAVILKESRLWGWNSLFITTNELRDSVRDHLQFDSESSIWDRCRTVDFLVIDDLNERDIVEKFFTIHDICGLIFSRANSGLVTIVISRLFPNDWNTKSAPMVFNTIEKHLIGIEVVGENRHQIQQAKRASLLE